MPHKQHSALQKSYDDDDEGCDNDDDDKNYVDYEELYSVLQNSKYLFIYKSLWGCRITI